MEFTPINDLEQALVAASQNPAARAHFYSTLLASELFVVTEGPLPVSEGKFVADSSTQIKLPVVQVQGQPHIPIFSARERISSVVKGEVGFIGANGRELLTMLKSANLLLNPGSPLGKVFSPQEIEGLLNGSIFQQLANAPMTFPVRLSPPEPAVPDLTEKLQALFAGEAETDRVYLSQVNFPPKTLPSRLLVGVEMNGDWPAYAQRVSDALKPMLADGQVVDVMRLDSSAEKNLVDYLKGTTPIFDKTPPAAQADAAPADSTTAESAPAEATPSETTPAETQSE